MKGRIESPRGVCALVAAALALSGCASMQPDPGLSDLVGVEYEALANGNRVIKSYSVEDAVPAGTTEQRLAACVARSIETDSVTLKDEAGSFTGAYSGKYYQVGSSSSHSTGRGITHTSGTDGALVIAEGGFRGTLVSLGIAHARAITYRLTTEANGEGISFTFTNIRQAMEDSGAARNAGFYPVGAHKAAGPAGVVDGLDSISSKVMACLRT